MKDYKDDSKKEINENELEEIAGGKGELKKGSAALMSSLMILGGAPSLSAGSPNVGTSKDTSFIEKWVKPALSDIYNKIFQNKKTEETEAEKEEKLLEFIKNPKISEAAEKAFEISNKTVNETKGQDHMKAVDKLSSYNTEWSEYPKTKIEKIFDDACSKGDLPIGNYTLKNLDNIAQTFNKEANGEARFYFYKYLDALEIHNTKDIFSDGDVVNLASQFNAMESPSSGYVAPVKSWPYDYTQGPRCALQSIEACKHREAAQLQGKLTDALKDILDECVTANGEKMTKKYPSLYKNGYLEPEAIKDNKDLQQFKDFICNEKNIERMKLLSQWVKCEGSEKMQLQVFSAAPNFGGKYWSSQLSDRDKLLKECCMKLIEVQYKALAQVASMRADTSGKRIGLHVTMIGNGVFSNPKDTIRVALKALKENLAGHNVDVYLHCYKDNIWSDYANELGINCESLN